MATTTNNSYVPTSTGSNYADFYKGYNDFMGTGTMKTLDTITDFIPFLGSIKNAGLGIWDLVGGNTAGGIGRLGAAGLGLLMPGIAGGLGKSLGGKAISAATKNAASLGAKVLPKAATALNWAAKAGLGKAVASGVGSQIAKSTVGGVDTDLQNAAESEQILGSDLVQGDFVRNLLNDLNSATVGEYDTYANDLSKQQEQDTASAAYSGMNAGNVGLSNLLKGNIANNYSNLMLNAQKNLSNQKTTNRLNAYNQNDAKIQQLIDYAASTGNNSLVEKLMKARTNIYSLGV